MTSSISYGFSEDCSEFLCDFAKLESPSYETFCQEWKRTNFQYIFYGRNTDAEIAEYTGEVFYIVKMFFYNCKNPFERIGAFYLLYTLYYKQPLLMFCKIRLTLSEWRNMKDFAKSPYNGQELPQITVILWKLFKSDAFRFVQDELEHGFDRFFVKSSNTNFDHAEGFRTNKSLRKELQNLSAPGGLINAMEILQMGYNEMKEALDDAESSTTDAQINDRIPQSTFMESIRQEIDSLGNMLRITETQEPTGSQPTPKENDAMGFLRESIRRKAYKKEVKKKIFRIAGRKSPALEKSDDEDSSPASEKRSASDRPARKRARYRNLRCKMPNLCIDEEDPA